MIHMVNIQQDIKCENYQLAAQSLAVDVRLHTLFDESRHEGSNEMAYITAGSKSAYASDSHMDTLKHDKPKQINYMEGDDHTDYQDDSDSQEDSDFDPDDRKERIYEDDNEFNPQAYVPPDSDGDDEHRREQGGVVHLVHGWIQQAHPERVSDVANIGLLC